jgi:phospholipid-binding lipoprotein MlaA
MPKFVIKKVKKFVKSLKHTSIVAFVLCKIIFFTNVALANQSQDNSIKINQFNFDDDYQHEEALDYNDDNKVYDPFEGVNRKIFAFNDLLDKNAILPIAKKYRQVVPKPIIALINNCFNNLSAPFSVINSIIQGDGKNAMASFSSFLINSTVGVFGIFDIASAKNIEYKKEDFGQSFGKYGLASGPYLVIPLIGPSNIRDFSGLAVEKFIDPMSMNKLKIGGKKDLINSRESIYISVANGVNTREGLIEIIDDVRKNSFDPYITIRSAYSQRRDSLINNK